MQKLLQQIIKFGFVGVISFVIDYLTGLVVLNVLMAMLSTDCFVFSSLTLFSLF